MQTGGPITAVTSGFIVDDWNIPVDSIANFQNGDLVLIYSGTTQAEVILITDDPFEDSNGQGYYQPSIMLNILHLNIQMVVEVLKDLVSKTGLLVRL